MMKKWFEVNGKYFDNEKEALAYEKELKQQEEERKVRKAKEEAERKAKEQKRDDLLKQINEQVGIINTLVKDYHDATGEGLMFVTENGQLKVRRVTYRKWINKDWIDYIINW